MCGDNGCNCLGDVYDLQDKIKELNNKLDDLTDEIKYLKEDMRSINKGTHKALKKWIEEYMDVIMVDALNDVKHDIRMLTDDVSDVQRKVKEGRG